MTIICAIDDQHANCVWLGSNDRTMFGSLVGPSISRKWTVFGDWVIGLSGSGPKLDALEMMRKKFPKTSHAIEVAKFMRDAYEEYDYGDKSGTVKKFSGLGIIAHKSGQCWDFDTTLCVNPVESGRFWARGSGMKVAIGAGAVLFDRKPSGDQQMRDLVRRAVEITIANETDCPGTPLIQKFDRSGELTDENP